MKEDATRKRVWWRQASVAVLNSQQATAIYGGGGGGSNPGTVQNIEVQYFFSLVRNFAGVCVRKKVAEKLPNRRHLGWWVIAVLLDWTQEALNYTWTTTSTLERSTIAAGLRYFRRKINIFLGFPMRSISFWDTAAKCLRYTLRTIDNSLSLEVAKHSSRDLFLLPIFVRIWQICW